MPPVVLGDFAVPIERTGEHRFPLHASPAEEKEGTKKINNNTLGHTALFAVHEGCSKQWERRSKCLDSKTAGERLLREGTTDLTPSSSAGLLERLNLEGHSCVRANLGLIFQVWTAWKRCPQKDTACGLSTTETAFWFHVVLKPKRRRWNGREMSIQGQRNQRTQQHVLKQPY